MTIRTVAAHSIYERAASRALDLQAQDVDRLYVVERDPHKEPYPFRVLRIDPPPAGRRKPKLPAGRVLAWLPPAPLRPATTGRVVQLPLPLTDFELKRAA